MENTEVILKLANLAFADKLLDYQVRNKDFLTPFTPKRNIDFYSIEKQKEILIQNIKNVENKNGYCFYIFSKKEELIIGNISISNIVRGIFQSCFLGYSLDEKFLNKGIMSYAIGEITEFAFNQLGLHRIEANVMPRNKPSIKVLIKNKFINEGTSKDYLKINNKWEDHMHFVLLNENFI